MALKKEAALRKDIATGTHVRLEHRHFAFIAAVIRDLAVAPHLRCTVAADFADRIYNTNPRFDRERFIAACCQAPSTPA